MDGMVWGMADTGSGADVNRAARRLGGLWHWPFLHTKMIGSKGNAPSSSRSTWLPVGG